MKSIVGEDGWFLVPEENGALATDTIDPGVISASRELLGHAVAVCLGLDNIDVKLLEEVLPDPENPDDFIDVLEVVVSCNGVRLQLPIKNPEETTLTLTEATVAGVAPSLVA
jgi:hypothetical protein